MTAVGSPPGRERHRADALLGFVPRLLSGLGLLVEGFRFLRRERRLWPLAVVPVLFALLSTAAAATLFFVNLSTIHALWAGLLPGLEATAWWTWLWVGPGRVLFWLIAWLAVALSLAVAMVAALLLANLASAPFLDLLSQRVERIVLGADPAPESAPGSAVADALRSFAAELQRLAFLAGLWLLITAVGLVVPGAQLLTGPLLVGITVLFLPLDYSGFALDRRRVSFALRRRWLRRQLPTMLGFGGVGFAACLVPGLNLLVLPSLVTAGTLLVLRAPPVSDPSSAGTDQERIASPSAGPTSAGPPSRG